MLTEKNINGFRQIKHAVDFCVIGGGLAGMYAAIAAARNGAQVLLMQDRPVLGGNASSEIRMWVRGAQGDNNRETGISEEVVLENVYRNPMMNFSIWDSVLYGKVRYQEGLKLLLNCVCVDAQMDGDRITTIRGWQTTTQQWHTVKAKIFADCSGDSVLAPLTGAQFRMGREGRDEFGEDIAPEKSDNCTMGMTCLLQARQTGRDVKFISPTWANKYTTGDLPNRLSDAHPDSWKKDNFWWIELGGMDDAIKDTEMLRDELLKVAFGVWDYIKNSGCCNTEGWELDWVGFLPGKRESRRYIGPYIMTQRDVRSHGKFDDLVAYGGWPMDDHHPAGIRTSEKPTIFHFAPSPYGIPFRCMYSNNIENLLFAGRNISVTHSAFSSCRDMATCGVIGQAVGTAAAIATKYNLTPSQVYEQKIHLLQNMLMDDDCYLPFHVRETSEEMKKATVSAAAGNISMLIDGHERDGEGVCNAFSAPMGTTINVEFSAPINDKQLRIVFDSDINRTCYSNVDMQHKQYPMHANIPADMKPVFVPSSIIKDFDLRAQDEQGNWHEICAEGNNYQRLRLFPLPNGTKAIKLKLNRSWGCEDARLYSLDICESNRLSDHSVE